MIGVTSVGIIGYGSFGSLTHELLRRLAPSVKVKIYSRRKKVDRKTFYSLEEVCAADAVVLTVSIRDIESILDTIIPFLGAETVLIDVATVKVYTTQLLKKRLKRRRYIATHPMFGPESYKKNGKNISGFKIVITDHTLKAKDYKAVVTFLKQCGFNVVEMDAKKHDKHLAETLFLTHFVGQSIYRGGFTRTDIDTVSFRFLMDAVESVQKDTALFEDVYRYNPYCERSLQKLEQAETEVKALLGKKK